MNLEIASVLVVLLLAAVLVLLLMLLRRSVAARGDAPLALEAERARAQAAAVEAGQLRGRLEAQEAEREDERARAAVQAQALAEALQRVERETTLLATLQARLVEREAALAQAQARGAALEGQLEALRGEHRHLHGEHARVVADLRHSRQAQQELRAYLDTAQEKLSGAFAELAGKVFEERGRQFEKNVLQATVQSRTDIEGLLKPFSDKLGEFRQRVDAVYGEEARERASLLGAVGELKTLNQDMAAQAAALTRALKGSAKVRGDWGELMLDSVLRGSGLEEGTHYQRQQHAVDDEGARLRPDVVVHFPDQRKVVVDSKLNLVAWQEAMNAATPEQHDEALRRHAVGLRQHVKDLGEKNYPKAVGGDALDITIAFVPIEGALSAALGTDSDLQGYAFDRRVVFASPNTLMALLRVTERLWTRDKVQKQALEISEVGGRVLDALSAFLAEFDTVGKRLDDASQAFNRARNRLVDSPQSALNRARRLAELGSKARRALPAELQPDAIEPLAPPGAAQD
ncbi:DNA recombination protein RmuC [Pseudoxanthomonas broegbernensis]|uniref:DNA recombination protein RmuC n=1 Tax=Pseudoxanthomonas broegbernensis TaxID=83619 RepID=A0A7V8GN92_9GAMM|nr:DNA recombination protein RmuC [Pseudoxanthomonas broegbernensis]KAF1686867.1 DNA recombination protein RmuC [Pseudoxanthomonas broegbernensis]MBB6065543.1 DNA recombination protein RmuC [Pseudoxanthomonas broegbernensis]